MLVQQCLAGAALLLAIGARNTLDWRMWLERDGNPASFWHDIPTYPDESSPSVINFVVEIPRWTSGKIEINREEPLNPIFHDEEDGEPRFVQDIWPFKAYPFLYGSIPQTWESPNFDHDFTGFPGDNDPMDAFDVSQDKGYTGQIKQVKILGGLAVNDGGETDWKMLVIGLEDPIASMVDTAEDLEKYRPGVIAAYRECFAAKTVNDSHRFWQALVAGLVDSNEISYNQTTMARYSDSYVQPNEAASRFDIPRSSDILPAAEKPEKFQEYYYISSNLELLSSNNP
ncbi:hypothetical protein BTJ68_02349 [Hortaea werneckii EXF-2000]|uniref:inorganic diphosphatase n=1 Tax=Hortaea werneckii EXF-2000 TaxID=1157616 RepID=A0A1Z5TLU3_HORWE|nr:hypothetical protein BTJ68_02349 [Hortaea werneckii EXF-2000]